MSGLSPSHRRRHLRARHCCDRQGSAVLHRPQTTASTRTGMSLVDERPSRSIRQSENFACFDVFEKPQIDGIKGSMHTETLSLCFDDAKCSAEDQVAVFGKVRTSRVLMFLKNLKLMESKAPCTLRHLVCALMMRNALLKPTDKIILLHSCSLSNTSKISNLSEQKEAQTRDTIQDYRPYGQLHEKGGLR
ncbi:hypothetical protein RRG08_003642 [Elysia crispata]|uniref:Uncharacterized protein n=1 Tax=Elysia crispata TaxID=231223 RepID=A0AAE1E5P5_9GAST|nr:hypothetical protein RRG08_003642 [Elysia crispata]